MDSDDLEFLQWAATAMEMEDAEYAALVEELQSEEFLEESTFEEDDVPLEEFYALAGAWDDWLDPYEWYELTCSYEER